jgi:hypothetical protein
MYHVGGVSAKDVEVDVAGGHNPKGGIVRLRRRPFGLDDVVEYRRNETYPEEWSCWGRFGPKDWPGFRLQPESPMEQLSNIYNENEE